MAWAWVNVKWDGAAGEVHARVKMEPLAAISNDAQCKNSNNKGKKKRKKRGYTRNKTIKGNKFNSLAN